MMRCLLIVTLSLLAGLQAELTGPCVIKTVDVSRPDLAMPLMRELIEELRDVVKLRDEVERELAGKGRVLLRYSGTESKIRLLIEGRELDKIDKHANRIADAIQNAIGVN